MVPLTESHLLGIRVLSVSWQACDTRRLTALFAPDTDPDPFQTHFGMSAEAILSARCVVTKTIRPATVNSEGEVGTSNHMGAILGLRSKHDASAALVIEGELVAAAAEERFTRCKHHFGFPHNAIAFVLSQAGLRPQQVDVVARDGLSTGTALRRLVRQARFAWTPRLYRSVIRAAWNRYFQHGKDIRSSEDEHLEKLGFAPNWFFVDHHLAHAAYAYYASGRSEALVITLDGQGHYLGGAVYVARGHDLSPVSRIPAEGGSLGMFYSCVTDTLGFQVGDGDGKTMGLAGYGDPEAAYAALEQFAPRVVGLQLRKPHEWRVQSAIVDDQLHVHYEEAAALRLIVHRFGKANVAAAAQRLLEERICELVRNAVARTGLRHVVGGGGVFLNVKSSKALLDLKVVDSIQIAPGPGDDGIPAGNAFAAYAASTRSRPSPMKSPYLGPSYSDAQILAALGESAEIDYQRTDDIADATAALLCSGQVVGWFQGRMEWGPRALGSRSVLADPRDPNMRDRINRLMKKRDWFMPFAPSVLAECCDTCFVNYIDSPYMNLAFSMRPPYDHLVPAVTHIDNTARPQAVAATTNPLFYSLISAFHNRTGIPMILNTSFNKHGLPIVCAPREAIDHLLWGCVDWLVIGPYLVRRTGGPNPSPASASATLEDAPLA